MRNKMKVWRMCQSRENGETGETGPATAIVVAPQRLLSPGSATATAHVQAAH